jgi:hypothetical protein
MPSFSHLPDNYFLHSESFHITLGLLCAPSLVFLRGGAGDALADFHGLISVLQCDFSFQRFLLQLVSPAAILDNSPAFLNVVETNPFKHLTHLSLKLIPGNDVEIKKFLAVCLKCSKVRFLNLNYSFKLSTRVF